MQVERQQALVGRLAGYVRAEGVLPSALIAARFLRCWFYKRKFKRSGSFLIRGSFRIRGAKFISIGSLRAGTRILIEAIDEFQSQRFTPEIVIGHGVCLSNDIHIGCTNRISLGENVLLGSHVFIADHDHGIYGRAEHQSAPDLPPALRPLSDDGCVVIEDNVHIGEFVTVLKNVRIGKGSVIGAHSVVTRDIPPHTIAAGSPARPIKKFDFDSNGWIAF